MAHSVDPQNWRFQKKSSQSLQVIPENTELDLSEDNQRDLSQQGEPCTFSVQAQPPQLPLPDSRKIDIQVKEVDPDSDD